MCAAPLSALNELTQREDRVLSLLVDSKNEIEIAAISYRKMAARLDLTRASCRRAVDRLNDLGLIQTFCRPHYRPSEHRVLPAAVAVLHRRGPVHERRRNVRIA